MAICLPAYFTSSVSLLFEEGFRENPNEPHHTRAYGLLNRCDSVNARGSQRIFQSDTSILPCLSGLFPLSDLWYSSHSPSHRPSTSTYSAFYSCPLVEHSPHWVLCRSLAGVNQRITLPLFYTVIILQIISSSLIVTGPLYHNWVGMSSVYCTLFHSFLRMFYCSPPTFPCRCNTFIVTHYPDLSRGCPRGGACGVGCTDLTTHLSHGLC